MGKFWVWVLKGNNTKKATCKKVTFQKNLQYNILWILIFYSLFYNHSDFLKYRINHQSEGRNLQICQKICIEIYQKIFQKIHQKIYQKICWKKSVQQIFQKICQKSFKKSVKSFKKFVKSFKKYVQKSFKNDLACNFTSSGVESILKSQ